MSSEKIAINRTLVGVIAVICLAMYGVMGQTRPDLPMWQAAFGRIGLVMSAFWLALPSKGREAAWANVSRSTLIGLVLGVVGVAVRPKIAVPVLAVMGVLGYLLRPRGKKRPENRRS
jgi:cytochrome bd-type quinol oxidase subunit 2